VDSSAVERLGKLLKEAGFDGERHAALREEAGGGLPPADTLAALGRPEDARLATLLALFAVGEKVPRPQAEEAIEPINLGELVDAGLLEFDGPHVRWKLSFYPFAGLIIVGDRSGEEANPAFVAHVTPSTKTIARLMPRRPAQAALDLGTGSGVLALLAARHADRVIGVDVNPRSMYFAGLNEQLNDIDGVVWAEGNWLDPVRGKRFDLVVGNLPFAVSPDSSLIYRESAEEGDELSRRLVQESAAHLAHGGFATLLCNWIHAEDAWDEPLSAWVAGLGCDAVLLRFGSQDPLAYAMTWASDLSIEDPKEFAGHVNRWIDYLNERDVEKIGMGAIVLRRRTAGKNWTRAFHLNGGPSGAGAEQLERVFAGCDFLERRPAPERFRLLLSSAWRLVDGHRLDQTLPYRDGAYATGEAMLRQDGLNLSAQVDPRVVSVLVGCNGQRPLSELIEESLVPEGLDQSGFHSLCLATVRELIARGFLVGDALERT
jgi:SAM-dependent methyltransferase